MDGPWSESTSMFQNGLYPDVYLNSHILSWFNHVVNRKDADLAVCLAFGAYVGGK